MSKFLFLLLFAGLAQAATFRWVDSQGKVHYGDVMPPQQAGMGHQELDKHGRIVRETPRSILTPEERRRRDEEIAAREEQKRRVEELQRRDRALLSTYSDEYEIDLARDRALELERLAQGSLKSRIEASTSKLIYANSFLARNRAARLPEPANIVQMRDEAQAELSQLNEAFRQRERTINDLKLRFEADKVRFQELMELKALARQ